MADFGKNRNTKDGLHFACKQCHREANARYREANREKLRAAGALYYLNHPGKKTAYNRANRDRVNLLGRKYRDRNREKERLRHALYKATHPEKQREENHRRRTRMNGGVAETIVMSLLVERDSGRCGICGKRVKVNERTIDHIVPVSKGGLHVYTNVRLAHMKCNSRRGNRGAAQLRLVG